VPPGCPNPDVALHWLRPCEVAMEICPRLVFDTVHRTPARLARAVRPRKRALCPGDPIDVTICFGKRFRRTNILLRPRLAIFLPRSATNTYGPVAWRRIRAATRISSRKYPPATGYAATLPVFRAAPWGDRRSRGFGFVLQPCLVLLQHPKCSLWRYALA